jgi:EmrB/QacA subfamily drug resistance transporter
MLQLIAFRGIQGIGGGILITSVFTLITDIYPPQTRGKYMGIVTSMFGLASIIGPLLGGFITDNLSWHWIFYINIPIGLIALCIILIIMPNYKSIGQRKQIDFAGTIFLVLALVPMLLAFRLAGTDYPWLSFPIIGMFTFSILMLILFVFIESKSYNPILPLSLFSKRSITVTLLIAFLTNGIMFAAIIYIPYFVQAILGSNATMSGAITTPMMLGLMLTSNLAGIISCRNINKKFMVILAFVLAAIGSGLLSTMSADSPYYLVIIFMVILGLGIGINMPICNINVQNSVPFHQISTATSTVQFFRNMGSTVGSAIFGTIMLNHMNHGFSKADSIRAIFLFSMIVALIGILFARFFKDAPFRASKPHQE